MKPLRDIDLAVELRALRPTPRPQFAAELDERAAAGFPRRSPSAGSPPARLLARLRAVEPRRMLLPVGAAALAAIVVATAVVAATSERHSELLSQPISKSPPARGGETGSGLLSERSGSTAAAAAGEASAPAAVEPLGRNVPVGPGPYASHATHRDVERSAQIVLGDDASHVRDDATKVFEAVQAYHGIVLHSSIHDGSGGEAGATFDLLIPSGKLADAMAAFSEIAEIRSRSESTADVTAPIVGLGERLQDARVKVESLLAQLAGAETEAERKVTEAKLLAARNQVAALRARLMALQRRTHLSSVSLRIETGGDTGHGGGWGMGSALHDAGRILTIAAGVTLVGLAVIVPVALICLLAWLAQRAWIRRSRERALGAK